MLKPVLGASTRSARLIDFLVEKLRLAKIVLAGHNAWCVAKLLPHSEIDLNPTLSGVVFATNMYSRSENNQRLSISAELQ